MADIFVSYATEDRDRVRPLVERLEREGWSVWWDRALVAGPRFDEKIEHELDAARCVVVAWSNHSVNSRWCRSEANEGLERNILVPLCIDEVRPPLAFRSSHTASLTSWPEQDGDLGAVLSGVRDCLGVGVASRIERGPETKSIAVLPFENQSNDPEQAYFSDGIAEDVLNTLAQGADLIVRPRSSSFAFRAAQVDSQSVGRQLNVTHVLEGSVRKAADRVRISAQLVEVATNRSIWSDRFDRRLTDVFEVQDEITSEILAALDVLLSSRRTPQQFASQEAYEAFLRARYAFSRYELKNAEDWLARAVALDPGNAEAWALRADVNAYQSANEMSPNDGVHRYRRRHYVEQALSIDPAHQNALALRALMDTHYTDRDYQTAIQQLVQLASAHPNNEVILSYLTFTLATIGRADLVERTTERLIRLAPRSLNAWTVRIFFGRLLFNAVDEAKAELARFPLVKPVVGAAIALAERDPSALAEFVPKGDWGNGIVAINILLVPYLEGDFPKARELAASLKQADGYQSHRTKAIASLVERDVDSAFAHYRDAILAAEQAAISQIQGPASWRRIFPEFFADSRYRRMLEEFKLDPESTATIQIPELPF